MAFAEGDVRSWRGQDLTLTPPPSPFGVGRARLNEEKI